MKLWSVVGLQAQSVACQTLDSSTSLLEFTLTPISENSQAEAYYSGDIRDLSPPITVPVLHVSVIDLELLFTSAERKPAQAQTQDATLTGPRLLPQEEDRSECEHSPLHKL